MRTTLLYLDITISIHELHQGRMEIRMGVPDSHRLLLALSSLRYLDHGHPKMVLDGIAGLHPTLSLFQMMDTPISHLMGIPSLRLRKLHRLYLKVTKIASGALSTWTRRTHWQIGNLFSRTGQNL
jgi:hypothetical protein